MKIESRINRHMISMFFVSILSELILFCLISILFGNHNIFIVLLFWVVYKIAVSCIIFVRWIAQLIYFHILFKDESTEDFFQYLVQNKFPMPSQYEYSVYDYLKSVFSCNKIKCDTKVSAAYQAGMLTFLGNNAHFSILNAYEQGLLKYRQYCLDNGIKEIDQNDDIDDDNEAVS